MKFEIFQINFTRPEVDQINQLEWSAAAKANPRVATKLTTSITPKKYTPSMFKHFEKVCEIEAADLDEAFYLMNNWPDTFEITRLSDRIASLSVGDIIGHEGKYWICADFGFYTISIEE